MDYGAHLPLMDFGEHPYTLDHFLTYAETAERLGFAALAANDHMLFQIPWIDSLTVLAAVLARTGDMALGTTVSLPIVRGPIQLSKALGAIDLLSGGRVFAALGPGSSAKDHAAVGLDFEERWKRLDEAVQAMRALLGRDAGPFAGQFYDTQGIRLEPYPAQPSGPPLWIGSWGSDAGLKRAARLGDGWLASAYNTTPQVFTEALAKLGGYLQEHGKDRATFPNALSTMWFYVTERKDEAERVLNEVLGRAVHRSVDELQARLPIGGAQAFAERLVAYREAGVQRVFMWPVGDDIPQLELFWERVVPLVGEG